MKVKKEILSFIVCCCGTVGAFGEILLADPSLVHAEELCDAGDLRVQNPDDAIGNPTAGTAATAVKI